MFLYLGLKLFTIAYVELISNSFSLFDMAIVSTSFQARRVWKFWLGVIVANACNQNNSVALTREDMVSLSLSIYILWKNNVLG
jgi:hypothetical protein